jgi:Zn-dependent peptidase ImmA (M78 family)
MMATRRSLARDAMTRAYRLRRKAGIALDVPVCVFDLITDLGVDLWFKAIPGMEGMYCKDPGPAIIVSSLRPPGRQAYTGGHELGHHAYGHGTRIDELLEEGEQDDSEEEFLADCFSCFLLMTKAAVERGFSDHGWRPATATPLQVYTVANWLGVGYEALVTHMQVSLGLLERRRADILRKTSPKKIKADLLRTNCPENLVVADDCWQERAIDIQVGDWVLATPGVVAEKACIAVVRNELFGTVLRGTAPGLGRITHRESGWSSFVRVSRKEYAGRGRFRHLEEIADEDDAIIR